MALETVEEIKDYLVDRMVELEEQTDDFDVQDIDLTSDVS